ncbi:Muskelin [Leucoagaricus sp. SymC.cos]|nr:Muskelin [Leucoagaricus sp. SymC.cos]
MISTPPSVALHYTVTQSTPHSGKYGPEHILLDKPQDQSSRWSGAYQGNNAKQWILLKLDQMSILTHPCNMKDFKVYVGITEDNLVEVLHGGLKNDTTPEAFPMRHVNNAQVCFPTRYVKIIPLSAHGQNFHTSIWHISMVGIADKKYVEHIYRVHEEHRESIVLRHILKHLRQRRLLTPYQDILSRAFTKVEHPLVTDLHTTLVLQGAFKESENHLPNLASSGLFSTYLQSSRPYASWSRITGTDRDGDMPCPRSGHAMCIDHVNGVVYVHGGFNSDKCLDDFWAYNIKEDKWHKISDSTHSRTGPSPRSCHKMVFDAKTGSIYVLGRLTDVDVARAPVTRRGAPSPAGPSHSQRPNQSHSSHPSLQLHPTTDPPATNIYCSEFYLYHTRGSEQGTWRCISSDTASSGGPPLIFDHQMVVDGEKQILYVHGGRVLDGDWDSYKYAGLYAYSLKSGRWKLLQPADGLLCSIPARHGHSMVLEQSTNTLFIFGGQREERYLPDMYTYDLDTNIATELFSNFTSAGGPNACFTQRAVIDTDLKEIYVFCGLTTDSVGMTGYLPGELYNWVYSPKSKLMYLFGGNASLDDQDEDDPMDDDALPGIRRMNDFWKMEVCRPGAEEIVRKSTYRIRRQQFREMCEDSTPTKALMFLQTQVSPVVNHDNQRETEDYRSLMTFLLAPRPTAPSLVSSFFPVSVAASDNPSPLSDAGSTESIADGWTKMKSRAGTPDDGGWSQENSDEDTDSFSRISFPKLSAELLRSIEDPMEKQQRRSTKDAAMSADRYAQRTEVFESLLEFVSEWDKEPSGSLLDFVTRNDTREDDV